MEYNGQKRKKFIAGITLATLVLGSSMSYAAYSYPKYTVGQQSDGSVVLPTDQLITPAGQQVQFSGRPSEVAISPDGQTAAFLAATFGKPFSIVIVDLATGAVKQQFDPGDQNASFAGIVYSKDGHQLYASMADGKMMIANVAADGTLSRNALVTLQSPSQDNNGPIVPGGLALAEDGKTIYVALNRYNSLGVFDLATQKIVDQIPVGNAPHSVVVVGDTAYVSDEGGRVAKPGDFTNDSSGTSIVADQKTGGSSTGTVSVVNLTTHKTLKSIAVGLHPTAMYLHDQYLFVANTNNDSVSVIDTTNSDVVQTIDIKPFPKAPFGSSPNGLNMTSDGRLIVSLGRNNALAVFKWQGAEKPAHLEGLIPTGGFPGGVGLDQKRGRLVVNNVVGTGSLDSGTSSEKQVFNFSGTASLIPIPGTEELKYYTDKVFHNNNWDHLDTDNKSDKTGNRSDAGRPVAVPYHLGDPSTIKHVFFIIKENNTYDSILGDDKRGNGDPNLVEFGANVTPNQHALAAQFPLFDNLYVSGVASVDGHQWTDQAYTPDYIEKAWGGDFVRSYPFNGGDSLAYAPTGFLWQDALNKGLTAKVYGEYASAFNGPMSKFGTWTDWYNDSLIMEGKKQGQTHVPLGTFQAHADVPSLDPLLNRNYPEFSYKVPDQYRADIFLSDFKQYVKDGNLPNLTMIQLPNDHTNGRTPGFPTMNAMMADNDLALGRIVDTISHSQYWKDSAIFVVEDDCENNSDHVDGHRTVGFVISPYVKRDFVDHTNYTQIDMVRTIEQILGLPAMNQMDLAARPMFDAFTDHPNFTPYDVVPNNVPLDQMNPQPATLNGIQKAWAQTSTELYKTGGLKMEFDKNQPLRQRDIWYASKGFNTPYPGDKKVLLPSEVNVSAGNDDK